MSDSWICFIISTSVIIYRLRTSTSCECAPGLYRCLQQIFRPSLWCLQQIHGVFPMQPPLKWLGGSDHISPALKKKWERTFCLFHHGFLHPGSNSWTCHPNFPFNMSISHGNILCFAAAGSMRSSVFTWHYWNGLWTWGANLPHFQVHTQLSYCWFIINTS